MRQEKDSLSNKWCSENWTSTWKIIKRDPHLTPPTKVNWKWITYFNLRLETIKLLKESIGSKLLGNYFWDLPPKTKAKKTPTKQINKSDDFKLKSSYTANETINKMKR